MYKGELANGVEALGAVDWSRRLFDSLIPLPDGTSYNAYLVRGEEKTVLIDTVDPSMQEELLKQLKDVGRIDYIVSNHSEQDHSGAIPAVLEAFPEAKVLATEKGCGFLGELLGVAADRMRPVDDGERLDLGGLTLEFVHTPWVHWPETMVTLLEEEGILFSCDFFGSHLATSELYVDDEARVYEAAKRYYAEIMMPFRKAIRGNMKKVEALEVSVIAPSHGPVYAEPAFIIDAYNDWISEGVSNQVVLPFVSMHGSTRMMVDRLAQELADRGVETVLFDLAVTDIGKLAIALVDAATVVVGTPTVHAGPHPLAGYAAGLANALRPKARFASVIGSYGWHGHAAEDIAGALPALKVELLEPVVCKGRPGGDDLERVAALAEAIAGKHREAGLMD